MFYIIKDGKQLPAPEGILKEYKHICKIIWGACPYDVSWAMDSILYKAKKNDL